MGGTVFQNALNLLLYSFTVKLKVEVPGVKHNRCSILIHQLRYA